MVTLYISRLDDGKHVTNLLMFKNGLKKIPWVTVKKILFREGLKNVLKECSEIFEQYFWDYPQMIQK